jgi:hypothetical protein
MDEVLDPLDGEADPSTWHFAAVHGPLPNPVGHTFPFLTHDRAGHWRLLGTGFYISRGGLFVTAKHVLIDDVLDGDQQGASLAIFHLHSDSGLFGPQELLVRSVGQCWIADNADIVLGEAVTVTNKAIGRVLSHWAWPLSWSEPAIGTSAATYAFPNHVMTDTSAGQEFHFSPALYRGTIEDVGDHIDRVMVPSPFIRADFRIHAKASGGPIFGVDGAVIGVNSTELAGSGPAFGVQIRCLQNAFLEGVPALGRLTFADLVERGVVTARHFAPAVLGAQPGHLVRLDAVPISAPRPRLVVDTMT